jgi:hypothetical protein
MIHHGRFLTTGEVSEILGVSVRGVYRYLSRGYLRSVRQDGKTGAWESDVLELKRVRAAEADRDGEPVPFAINRATLSMLHARVTSLEMKAAVLARILGVRHEPLALTDPEIVAIYTTATSYAAEGWPPHAEGMWADMFLRMRLDDLQQLHRLTADPHPWCVFHKLCATMALAPANRDLRDELVQGRANLFSLAGMWSQMHGVPQRKVEALVHREAAPGGRLVRKLQRTRGMQEPVPTDGMVQTGTCGV